MHRNPGTVHLAFFPPSQIHNYAATYAQGHFKYVPNMKRRIGMVAGGTGITPMFQVIQAVLNNSEDRTKIDLVFANVTEDDILLRTELDAFAAAHKTFKVHYMLDKPSAGWAGGSGYVTKEVLKEFMPQADDDVIILRCGPPPMVKGVATALSDLGYSPDMLFE